DTRKRVHCLRPNKGIVWAVAFSPDGRVLAAAVGSNGAYLWDVATGETRGTLPHWMRIYRLAFSPDGRHLATVSQDQTVRLWDWDVPTKQPAVEIRGARGCGPGARASPGVAPAHRSSRPAGAVRPAPPRRPVGPRWTAAGLVVVPDRSRARWP